MADLAFSTGNGIQVKPIDPDRFEGYDILLVSGVSSPTHGDAMYYHPTTGYTHKSSAGVEGTAIFAGLLVQKQGLGATMMTRGRVAGFNVNHLNYGAPIYLSNTAGKLADEAGTIELQVGVVVPMSDDTRTKVIYIYSPFWYPPTPEPDAGGD
jgi:hypothetical protein